MTISRRRCRPPSRRRVQQRDERLGPFEREPLLARGTWCAGTSRTARRSAGPSGCATLRGAASRAVAPRLHRAPAASGGCACPGCACTRRRWSGSTSPAARSSELPERAVRQAEEMAGVEGAVEVGVGEAELGKFEQRLDRRRIAERIEVGQQMAEAAIGVDQADDADLLPARFDVAGLPAWPSSKPSKNNRHDSSTEAGS